MSRLKHNITIIKGNGAPLRSEKQGRNELYKCGSGKKVKRCCGDSSKYFMKKLRDKPADKEGGL